MTFNSQAVAFVSYSLGSEWTTAPYTTSFRTSTSSGHSSGGVSSSSYGSNQFITVNHGTFAIVFDYQKGHYLDTSKATTVFTITWKVLSKFAFTDFHIVSPSETSCSLWFCSTELLVGFRHGLIGLPYTTTDGSFSNRNHLPHGFAT